MKELEQIWVRSKWTPDKLDKKHVEFDLLLKDGGSVNGLGRLTAHGRLTDSLLSIQIEIRSLTDKPLETRQTVFVLPQTAVDLMEVHPNQATADFRLKMV